jgi:hypothetical protein
MIRIDEIYNHTFWPWVKQNQPLTRIFFCDPPGRTDPESLFNFGEDVWESNYMFFHDQEPIHLDIHSPLFDDVVRRNRDLNHNQGPSHSALITSERDSDFVDQVCSMYQWRPYYYFFHGWAALDWYRGYDRTLLMPAPTSRKITRSFISPNRIVAGRRQHRIELMYHLLRQDIRNACISFPAVCPVEGISVIEAAHTLSQDYSDIQSVLAAANFPWNFPGEQDHPMHSCWLSLFESNAQSLCHVITETVCYGKRHHLTEKTFKPICLRMPFVMVSSAGSLAYLRSYGFKTFGSMWDESYDLEINDHKRILKISQVLAELDRLSPAELQDLFAAAMPVIEHNFQHFYQGGFEKILWQELTEMLGQIKKDWQ